MRHIFLRLQTPIGFRLQTPIGFGFRHQSASDFKHQLASDTNRLRKPIGFRLQTPIGFGFRHQSASDTNRLQTSIGFRHQSASDTNRLHERFLSEVWGLLPIIVPLSETLKLLETFHFTRQIHLKRLCSETEVSHISMNVHRWENHICFQYSSMCMFWLFCNACTIYKLQCFYC